MSKSNGHKAKPKDIGKILSDLTGVTRAVRQAARDAVLAHKRAGKPIAVWKNGKARLVKP